MAISIDQVIEQIPEWGERPLVVEPLGGGLTNTIYRVEVAGTRFVVRIPGASTDLLAVDRANELYNTRAAATAGIGPKVVHYLPAMNVMVLEYLSGETMTLESLQRPGMPTRMAQSISQLHAGPRFLHDFNMFRLIERYLQIVRQRDIRIPEGFGECLSGVAQIETAFAQRPLHSVPCHNDLLAGNFLDDGDRLWLIDFEYSGNNDPTFELGNVCQEQQFDEDRIAEMCAAYFGGIYPDRLARMKLNMIMSDVGWTLWAAIQASISTIAFDYWGWAIERWGRANMKLNSPEFNQWLQALEP